MGNNTLTFLPTGTRAELRELSLELGIKDPRDLVRKAVEEKLLDMKRATFFGISEKVRKGLVRKGVRSSALLKSFKS